MIGNYAIMAVLNARKAPFTTAAKVLTLALGLLVLITVSGVIAYWRSADRQITPAGDAVVALTTKIDFLGLHTGVWPNVQPMQEVYMRAEIPEIRTLAGFQDIGGVTVSAGGRTLTLNGANAGADFFKIFAFPFVAGDLKTALQQEDAIVLSQSAAQRLFGESPALGRRLVLNGDRNLVVTGVMGAIPQPSWFDADFIARARPTPPGRVVEWGIDGGSLYAVLPKGMTRADLETRLAPLPKRHPGEDSTWKVTLGAIPISQQTELRMNQIVFGNASGSSSVISALNGLALLVLVVACLNYANLATAQTLSRAREIGMRRVLGAGPIGVLAQGWIESGLAAALALVLTGVILALTAPIIKTQIGVDAVGALVRDPHALAQVAFFVVVLALVAGLYPAFLALRARPVDALRGGKLGGLPHGVGQVLVGLQFASASGLLIALIVVGHQNEHSRKLALDRGGDKILVLPSAAQGGISLDLLREQLRDRPEIKAVGGTREPWAWRSENGSRGVGLTPEAGRSAPDVSGYWAGFGYFDAYGQRLLAGRDFDPARDQGTPAAYLGSDGVYVFPPEPPGVAPIVIDEKLSRQLGFATPVAAVGRLVYRFDGKASEIIGVVETKSYTVRTIGGTGAIFTLETGNPDARPIVRLGAKDVEAGLAAVRQAWSQLAPDRPFSYRFEDEIFDEKFKIFTLVSRLFGALALVALLISFVGLFGMAAHATQRRLHEIGVRKTLGSTRGEVVRLLLTDFSKPVILANLLVWPAAYWGAKAYLARFTEPIELTPWPFAMSLVITTAIAWLAVGGQTLRAASITPAQVLRDA